MRTSAAAVVVVRCALAVLSIAGVVTQTVVAIRIGFDVVSVFSYFTILGNLFASAVFLVAAYRDVTRAPSTPMWEAVRGANCVYLAFVGIVFNTILVGSDLGPLVPWVNVVHHMLVPAAVVADWLLFPPRSRLAVRWAWWTVVVPAAYTAYTLIRGPIAGFYPYPFFNPARVGGYGGVATYCAVLLVVFVLLAFGVRAAGNALGARAARRARPDVLPHR